MKEFELGEGELAGIELAGYRQLNNTIQFVTGTKRFIDDWPQEIYLLGSTYTLEDIQKGAVNEETGVQYENAIYV